VREEASVGLPFLAGKTSADGDPAGLHLGKDSSGMVSSSLEGFKNSSGLELSAATLAASAPRPCLDAGVVSQASVDELSHALLLVSDEAKHKNMSVQQPAVTFEPSDSRVEDLKQSPPETTTGSVGPGDAQTTSKTEDVSLSPASLALLCDEGDDLVGPQMHDDSARTSSILNKSRKEETTLSSSKSHAEREKSVLMELAECVQKITATCKRRR